MRAIAILLLLAAGAGAQAAGGAFYLAGSEPAWGGATATARYRLTVGGGHGVVVERSSTTRFVLQGGFPAAVETTISGRPWVATVDPQFAPILGGASVNVHGAALDLGSTTGVTIDGVAAIVTARGATRVAATVPRQSAPGWKTVEVTNAGGTAHLAHAVGILPLLERKDTATGSRLTYRGATGDVIFLVATGAKLPVTVPIAPYHHGLELNLGALVALLPALPVTDPAGVFTLDLPRNLGVWVQALALNNPGYTPGSFTNTVKL